MRISLRIEEPFYYLIIIYSFIIGGILQFFFGFSNTVFTFLITFGLLIIHLLYSVIRGKVRIDSFTLLSLIIVIYISVLSILSSSSIIKTFLYSIIVLLPLALYHLEKLKPGRYSKNLKRILLLLFLVQIPVILLQINLYDYFIPFNNSGQGVDKIDIRFGTFLLKNDHALGFFLLANLLYLGLENDIKINKLYKYVLLLILMSTIFIINSKLTLILFFLTGSYIIYVRSKTIRVWRNIRINKRVWYMVPILFIVLYSFWIKPPYYKFISDQISIGTDYEMALLNNKSQSLKRGQIINLWLHEDINWFGRGPYSFYDIEEGTFTDNNVNFSHWLWIYNDLGLIGLLLLLIVFILMSQTFNTNLPYSPFLSFLLFMYGFFTIITFDISILLTYFIYKKQG